MSYEIIEEQAPDDNVAFITAESLEYLKESARWAKFLSIVGFIGLGFMLFMSVMFFSIGDLLSEYFPYGGFPLGILGVLYLIFVVIGFFPINYLFQFGRKTLKAIAQNDAIAMEIAFRNQKSFFKFSGIVVILSILPSIIIFVTILSGTALASFLH